MLIALSGCLQVQDLPKAVERPPLASATIAATLPPPTSVPPATPTVPPVQPTGTPTEPELPPAGAQLGDHLSEAAYLAPLTIRHLTPSTASFSFALDRPQGGYLLYRPDLPGVAGWFSVPLDPEVSQHQLTLDNLRSDQRYLAQVGLGEQLAALQPVGLGGRIWGPLRFETPAEGTPPLRIGVIGDSGYGESTTTALVNRLALLELDLVLHTGDVVYNVHEEGDPAEAWAKKYFWPFAPLLEELPIYPVPGNHDYDRPARLDGRPFYFHAFPAIERPELATTPGFPWYSFSWAGIQFLMLDSQLFHGVAGRSEQTAWLRERLDDPAYRYSIAVFHTPPYTSGLHTNDGAALRAEWTPLFEAAGVPLVLSGHDHNYERFLIDEVTYVVSGGGSRVLYPLKSRVAGSQAFAEQSHIVLLEVDAAQITLTAIGLQGEVLDRVTIEAPR